MALSNPKQKRTYSDVVADLMARVPNVSVPISYGPGEAVSQEVPLRDIVGSFIPQTELELALGVPMGQMMPKQLKGKFVDLLKEVGRQTARHRIIPKMLRGDPGLGKAAEALGLVTGKVGGFGSDLGEASTQLDNLYTAVQEGRHFKVRPTGLPEIDTRKALQSFPTEAAENIARGMRMGLPRQTGLRRVTPDMPLTEADPERLREFREMGIFPTPATGLSLPGIGEEAVDISDIERLLEALAKRQSIAK